MANITNLFVKWFAIAYSRILILRILVRVNEMYTNEEYCEMVLLYGQYNRNKRESARLYAIKFPSRRHSSYCTIASAVQRLYKTGSCHRRIPLSRATPSSLRIPAEDVLGYALSHPESSVRDISKACFYSKVTV
ncbi:DUF4817 domain-containing protein [Trichonephila clavipes]|nr:DUF4817 domain-containing protein [Trichonephila clavipes]